MGKSYNNPFAVNPEMKFGLSPDPSVIRPEVRMQENRSGVQRIPQRPVYQGTQRPQPISDQRNAANRGYRIPSPTGAVPVGVPRQAMAPTAPLRANVPQQAAGNTAPRTAGNGAGVSSQAVSTGNSTRVSVGNQDTVVNRGLANARAAVKKAGGNMVDGLKLDFSGDNLMRGFVMSEVLGRPKSLRRGRW